MGRDGKQENRLSE